MLKQMKKLLPLGRFLLILPLILMLALVSCGSLLDEGTIEDAILDYIDQNVDDYNETASGAEDEPIDETQDLWETELTDAPETDAPETDAPETDAPETEAPETEAPETETPETKAPETDAPETKAPETKAPETEAPETDAPLIDENGVYTTKDDVALYIHTYGKLPKNFITKKEAENLGWPGGSLEPYAPGKCIGGSYFGNYEGLLPTKKGRTYTECDIDTLGAKSRGAKRIVFSNDGLIYYTDDHYESFELLYGEAD